MKKLIALILVGAVSLLALTGCNKVEEQSMKKDDIAQKEIGTGGKVDRSDYSAPKEIKSDNLVSFSCSYFLYGEVGGMSDSSYGISVTKEDDGKFILSEEVHGISCETDEEYLRKVQEIIKEYDFASINGLDSHTSGLPTEFQPCYFSALYDSGEKIYFSENNNPESEWGRKLLKITQEEFTNHGITVLNPPIEDSVVTRFMLTYTDGDMCYYFSEVEVPVEGVHKSLADLAEEGYGEGEYEIKLQYQVWDRAGNLERKTYRGDIDETYYEFLRGIIFQNNINEFASLSGAPVSFNYQDSPAYYEFYIEFEDGSTLCGFSDDPDMNAKFAPAADEIATYIKSYLDVE